MKVLVSLAVTLFYAILMALVFFAVQGLSNLLKSVGLEHFVVGVIIAAYFLYIWRDSYKKLTKEV